jgi:hypothetical protein
MKDIGGVMKLYDQEKIPDEIFEMMKELKDVERIYKETSKRREKLVEDIKNAFPTEEDAMAVRDGIAVFWKMGKRTVGDADIERLRKIDGKLVRKIPEKIIPATEKPQTLKYVDTWLEEAPESMKKDVYGALDIKQKKDIVIELTR